MAAPLWSIIRYEPTFETSTEVRTALWKTSFYWRGPSGTRPIDRQLTKNILREMNII
jgi:hypothetical protein